MNDRRIFDTRLAFAHYQQTDVSYNSMRSMVEGPVVELTQPLLERSPPSIYSPPPLQNYNKRFEPSDCLLRKRPASTAELKAKLNSVGSCTGPDGDGDGGVVPFQVLWFLWCWPLV